MWALLTILKNCHSVSPNSHLLCCILVETFHCLRFFFLFCFVSSHQVGMKWSLRVIKGVEFRIHDPEAVWVFRVLS